MELDLFFAISSKNPVTKIIVQELITARNEKKPLYWWQIEATLVTNKYFIVQNYSPLLYSYERLSTVQKEPIWGPVMLQISPFTDIHKSILNLCGGSESVSFFDLRKFVWKEMGRHSWMDLCLRPDPKRIIASLSLDSAPTV